MKNYQSEYEKWLSSELLSDSERNELLSITEEEKQLRFGAEMAFGTAGLRALMRPTGTAVMNVYTVARATQAMAELIKNQHREKDGVAIAYDSRINSELFARVSAGVLAANGIKVYIFDGLRPTPELSFALRAYKCVAGINVTASHNPKEYNGYKAYWDDGAQLPPEHAKTVSDVAGTLDIFSGVKRMAYEAALDYGLVTVLGKETDDIYVAEVEKQMVNRRAISDVADSLKIVYTPLHGAGYRLVPRVLRECGLKNLFVVKEQGEPDGNFPTTPKPNPEFKQVFELGMKIAEREGSDLVVATDPDCDRAGVITRTPDGGFACISGNRMGALLLDYIITAYKNTGTMPKTPYAVKTIVTTSLAEKVCVENGVSMHNVLTGFKFIGEVIKNEEARGNYGFIFGFEESYGYLKGTYARDKDGVLAVMLICEMTAYYKAKNMTLYDALNGLFKKYGYFSEYAGEVVIKGLDASEKMTSVMKTLRSEPPKEIGGGTISEISDYLSQKTKVVSTGELCPTGLPSSDVLYFKLECGDVCVIRPSGTEPKIKIYYLLRGADESVTSAKFEKYKSDIAALMSSAEGKN